MRFGQRQFRPSWLMSFMTFVGLIIFISLGGWQLDRANFKLDIQQQFEARLASDYVIADADYIDAIQSPYYKVQIEGDYLLEKTLYLDNRVHQGKAGYEVITPFRLKNSARIILINRGWRPLGVSRQHLPQIETPELAGTAQGILSQVAQGFRLGEIDLSGDWPQLLPFVDIDLMQPSFDQQLLPFVLWLSPDQVGLYVRDWRPVWSDPQTSRAYAMQWFAFALILLGLYVGLNLRVVHE